MNYFATQSESFLLHTYHHLPITIKKAKGSYVTDVRGKTYLDMFSGIAVLNLGHRHPAIQKAIKKQLRRYSHVSNYFLTEAVSNLSEILCDQSFASKVFFTNSGTEAIEAAIKLSHKYGQSIHPDKKTIVVLSDAFHGRTIGSLSLTPKEAYQKPFQPLMPDVVVVPKNDLDALNKTIDQHVCAIFLEVIQGEAGVIPIDHEYIKEVQRLADAHQVLIVVDEIQTGLMRTGTMFAYQNTPLRPHVMTLAKALGGGLPLGAMLVDVSISDVIKPGEHGSTFGGNPVAAAAGYQMLKCLTKPSLKEEVSRKSAYLFEGLSALAKKYPLIQSITGKGMMIGVDVGDYATQIKEALFEERILINVTNQTVIRLLPALNIPDKALARFMQTFEKVIEKIT